MSVKEKIKAVDIKKITRQPMAKQVIAYILYFLLGLGMSLGGVLAGVKPFGVSATAVSKKKYFIFSALGAIIGYLAFGLNAQSARYLVAIIIAGLGAFGASYFDFGHTPSFSMALSGLSVFATGVVLNFKMQGIAEDYLLTICEAILSSGGAFFMHKALSANYKRLRFKALPISDITCIMVTLSLLLMNLSGLTIGTLSPARAVAVLIILISARFGGDRWGMLTALSLGFALGFNSNGGVFIVGAYAFSTLLSILFSSLGAFAMSLAFICSLGVFCIADGTGVALCVFIEGVIGSVVFSLLPRSFCNRLEEIYDTGKNAPSDASLRQSLVMKLRFASSAMVAISDSVDQVRERINDIVRAENEKNKNDLSEEEYIRNEIILEKTNQIRMVASDQFGSIAGMLEDLAFEFDDSEMFDSASASRIRTLLGEYEIYPSSISVIEDKFGRKRVEILNQGDSIGLENDKLCTEIGKICSRYFEKGRITNFKNEAMLTFNERPSYKLSVGFAQHSAQGTLCGDTVKILNDNKGHTILIISDGMGKGSRAALDGAMGAGLLSRLINAGFGFDSALKIVNSALLVKSNDESLATLDIASIDLFTGKCEIFKAGAPASYIIKGESITKCELSSMPAGILRGIEFAKRTAVLSPENDIVLLSDGITDLGDVWLEDILLSLSGNDCQANADKILDSALEISIDDKIDDMSVIYARLERN